jgi:hypothetical protein
MVRAWWSSVSVRSGQLIKLVVSPAFTSAFSSSVSDTRISEAVWGVGKGNSAARDV